MWRPETNADRAANAQREYANEMRQPQPANNVNVVLPSWEDSSPLFTCLYGASYVVYCCGCCTCPSMSDWADFIRGES